MQTQFCEDFSFVGKFEPIIAASKLIWEDLFIDKLWNVGNPPICQYNQQLLNLHIPINRMETPLHYGKVDKIDSDPNDLAHLRYLSFKET